MRSAILILLALTLAACDKNLDEGIDGGVAAEPVGSCQVLEATIEQRAIRGMNASIDEILDGLERRDVGIVLPVPSAPTGTDTRSGATDFTTTNTQEKDVDEPDFVKKIRPMTELPVVMLVADKAGLDTAMAMSGAPFWDGLGPNLNMLFDANGKSTGVVEAAHAKGIVVHPWTFRTDAPLVKGEPIEAAMKRYLALGIDGFFTDFPITGYKVRNEIQYGGE